MKPISFIVNTSVNTLDHVKILIRSLKENLDSKDHEILIFIDSDNEGTIDWLRTQKSEFNDLKIVSHKVKPCVGYSRNCNLLVDLSKHDIVSYFQSDMVIGPHYDTNILSEVEDNCILSATRVEPPLHGISDKTIVEDFGTDPNLFDFNKWNAFSESVKSDKTIDYFFAPYTFHKQTWKSIGGYDTLFRRGREDSDFVQRCVQAGIKLKQTFKANVYHFTCVSSRGKNWFDPNNEKAKRRLEVQKMADSIEMSRFIKKWGGFNHGESLLVKLDSDLVISQSGVDPRFILSIEPFFSRVWLRSKEDRTVIMDSISHLHEPANELLGFSYQDWENAKHLYNKIDYESVYKIGAPDDWNIKIDLDLSEYTSSSDIFFQNIVNLSQIIGESDPGIYELGCAKIDVKKVVKLSETQIEVKNPPFDYNLLVVE